MKIATYNYRHVLGIEKRLGIIINDTTILDPNFAFACDFEREGLAEPKNRANHKCPSSLHKLLRLSDNPLAVLNEAVGLMHFFQKCGHPCMKDGTPYLIKTAQVALTAPLDKIETYRDFFIHEKHVATGFKKRNEPIPPAWFEIPVYYKGATAGFIGNGDEILWPSYSDLLDYELELGMVIGRDGKNIKARDAHKHILGFTILNDVSARDIQRKEMTVRLGPSKAKDFCSVIGPVIVTLDEFVGTDPDLLMTAKINGVEWSRGRSGDAHYSWGEMIEFASKDEWILASDFFGSGTVGTGCGLELDKWIRPGDKIELEIEKIGKLVNTVGQKTNHRGHI